MYIVITEKMLQNIFILYISLLEGWRSCNICMLKVIKKQLNMKLARAYIYKIMIIHNKKVMRENMIKIREFKLHIITNWIHS